MMMIMILLTVPSMAEEGCLLVMVVDMHPQLAEHDAHTYFNAVVAFANLHLAANARNSLAVLAANHLESRFLYPGSDEDGVGGAACCSVHGECCEPSDSVARLWEKESQE